MKVTKIIQILLECITAAILIFAIIIGIVNWNLGMTAGFILALVFYIMYVIFSNPKENQNEKRNRK